MKKYIFIYLKLFGIVGIVVALDQWTKWLVRENIPFATQWLPENMMWLFPYARLVNWYNTGAAFGMFQDASLIFTVLAFVVIGLIIFYYPQVQSEGWIFQLALALQLSGAIGNLIDRLMQDGKVTDFISVGSFPVFNVADSAITIGTALLLFGVWKNERAQKKSQAEVDALVDGESSISIEE